MNLKPRSAPRTDMLFAQLKHYVTRKLLLHLGVIKPPTEERAHHLVFFRFWNASFSIKAFWHEALHQWNFKDMTRQTREEGREGEER